MVTFKELRWVLFVSIMILTFSSLPYLAGFAAQTPDLNFSGAVIDRQDYSVHLATMHLGMRGDWQYHFRFSSEAQHGVYIKLGYIFLGHVARWIGLNLEWTYHIARWVFGLYACLAIYGLAAISFSDVFWRRVAFLIAVMGAGLGWLQLVVDWIPIKGISPTDFWLIDAYVFFGILAFPHFAAVTALLVTMIVSAISYLQKAALIKGLLTIFCSLCIQLIQPYAVVLPNIAIGGAIIFQIWYYRRIRWQYIIFYLVLILSQLPLLYYNLVAILSDPLWHKFLDQNITLSPPLIYYLLGFGILWLLALFGGYSLYRKLKNFVVENESSSLKALGANLFWSISALVLAYLPINLQRRFMHAYSIPLAILAVAGIKDVIFPWIQRHNYDWFVKKKASIGILFIAMASMSMILLVLSSFVYILQKPSSLFDPGPMVKAVDWLAQNAKPDDVVLSEEQTGQMVAARSGLQVYLGHPIETLDYQDKLKNMEAFYSGNKDPNWLYSNGIVWVIDNSDEFEGTINSLYDSHLDVAYKDAFVTIYKVQR